MTHACESSCPAAGIRDAVKGNVSVRDFTAQKLEKEQIERLLHIAVQAPTAMHMEPWRFAVIQDAAVLKTISDRAKQIVIENAHELPEEKREYLVNKCSDPDMSVFYNSGTLIVIYAKPVGHFADADCWLAAENMLIGASAMGLGACVIGLAVQALNEPEIKRLIGVPDELTAYAPIIFGTPAEAKPVKERAEPVVVSWKD